MTEFLIYVLIGFPITYLASRVVYNLATEDGYTFSPDPVEKAGEYLSAGVYMFIAVFAWPLVLVLLTVYKIAAMFDKHMSKSD
jgi:hypothetical protein